MLILVADGGCNNKTGKGGWGYAIVRDGIIIHEEYGIAEATTNQRMELAAIENGLHYIYSKIGMMHPVLIKSDSKYAIGLLTLKSKQHKKLDLFNKAKNHIVWQYKATANKDIVDRARLLVLCSKKPITFQWVKGHSGDCPFHDRVDKQIYKTYNLTTE